VTANFGQKPFKFPPPDGYQPLNNANIRPETVISRPDQFVGATLWTGNGGTRNIDVGHKSDFVWIKKRNSTSYGDHMLFDTVRGATKFLKSQTTGAEGTDVTTLTAFTSDGFTIGAGWEVNKASDTYVAWTWKAGGSKNTFNVDDVGYATAAAAGLTGGDITPTGASVGTKQGFSIIKYAGSGTNGDTLPHGLLQTPDFIITKNLTDGAVDWIIKPVGLLTDDSYMLIFNTNAQFQGTGGYISAQTSTLLTLTEGNNDGNYNNSGDNYVMYAWHDVPGLQKFGAWSANGQTGTGGPYIHTGFKPSLILIKKYAGQTDNWFIFDTKRDSSNVTENWLLPNTTAAETSDVYNKIDILSDGFAIRVDNADYGMNVSNTSFIYAAWAEAPTVDLFGGGANAR